MTEEPAQKVPIQDVLVSICEELFALSHRLQQVENVFFDQRMDADVCGQLEGMQDMDLIIQQIADLARAIGCISEVELGGLNVPTDAMQDRLHLGELRQRLLGISEQRVLAGAKSPQDIQLF